MADHITLRLGDNDENRRWDGRKHKASAQCGDGHPNTLCLPNFVRAMQEQLHHVGIKLCVVNGKFDAATEASVREFQIYAKMDIVAKEDPAKAHLPYADRLAAQPSTKKYGGPISGVFDRATKDVLDHWVAPRHRWRCPVVLDVFDMSAGPPPRKAENVWRASDSNVKQFTVRARDFTRIYGVDEKVWSNVGKTLKYKNGRGPVLGPEQADHVTPEDPEGPGAEVLPETLLRRPWGRLGAEEQSTFRVVRAVAEIECHAFFDVVNGYDDGVISEGICHFIVRPDGAGELAELLTQFASHYPGDYRHAIERFGVNVVPPFPLFRMGSRFRFQDETGGYPEPRLVKPKKKKKDDKEPRPLPEQPYLDRIEQLRNWHWFYRFVMLGRHVHNFRLVQWQSAVDRLREIRARKAHPPKRPTHPVSDVFTSELAMAYLYRWDVNRPSDITGDGKEDRLDEIVAKAMEQKPRLGWKQDPSKWGQPEEDALLEAIETVARTRSNDEIPKMFVPLKAFPKAFPEEQRYWMMKWIPVGPLSTDRGSFRMVP